MKDIKNNVKKRHSADLILNTLFELLNEKSYDEIKVIDIYQRCYVARSTFYHLFKNMDDVLYYAIDKQFSSFMDDVSEIADEDLLSFFIEKAFESNRLLKIIMENNRYHIVLKAFEDYDKKIIDLKHYETEKERREAEYTLSIFVSVILGGLRTWYRYEKSDNIKKISKIIINSIDNLHKKFENNT